MKKSDLKQIIKPIVEECVQESVRQLMLESGLLSSIISEVVGGLKGSVLVEELQEQPQQQKKTTNVNNVEMKNKLDETKRKLVEAVGRTGYSGVDLFENISSTIPDETKSTPANPLGSIAPNDPGVNISNLINPARMNAHLNRKKG